MPKHAQSGNMFDALFEFSPVCTFLRGFALVLRIFALEKFSTWTKLDSRTQYSAKTAQPSQRMAKGFNGNPSESQMAQEPTRNLEKNKKCSNFEEVLELY